MYGHSTFGNASFVFVLTTFTEKLLKTDNSFLIMDFLCSSTRSSIKSAFRCGIDSFMSN
jgi:hypothetical protein